MSTIQIRNINEMELSTTVREKIIKQVNFAGLEKNLTTGDFVAIKIGDETYQIAFNKEEALQNHKSPLCSQDNDQGDDDISFSNRIELSALLNLKAPVSEAVFLKAKEDSLYLHNLLVSKNTPEFLKHHLQQANSPTHSEVKAVHVKKTNKLIVNFGKAMLKWGASGFSNVDKETYKQRLKACSGCDKLAKVPDKLIYNIMGRKDKSGICSSCGCLVAKKALVSTDTCPEVSLENTNLNRWGEKISSSN